MEIQFGKKLGGVAGALHLYHFLSKIGVEAYFYRKCYVERLKENNLFFERNKERIVMNLNLFQERYSKEVYKKAIKFRRTHLLRDRPPYCKEQAYFNSLTPINGKEVLIDCGGFTGDTVQNFIKFSNGKYKRVISFEPDSYNYAEAKKNLTGIANCKLVNCGVWSSTTQLSFKEDNNAGSKVDVKGGGASVIDVVAIDEMPECKGASFIKMDIEGAELMSLNGAYRTITANRPILAICLYHTNEDMLSIPEWMKDNVTDYDFFCRHHSYYQEETILYAIPKERKK